MEYIWCVCVCKITSHGYLGIIPTHLPHIGDVRCIQQMVIECLPAALL